MSQTLRADGRRPRAPRLITPQQRLAAQKAPPAPDLVTDSLSLAVVPRATDERGGVLMVLQPDEVEALRRYWDTKAIIARQVRLVGRGHG